jgi:hypothetical protein
MKFFATAAALLFCCATAQAAEVGRDANLFAQWKTRYAQELADFEQHLASKEVADVVPAFELLRSASMWKQCGAQPFTLPPKAQWNQVVEVLGLLKELRAKGAIGKFEVVSGYRDPKLNQCAGGARGSAHMDFAVDLLPLEGDPGSKLCSFWRTAGQAWNMGMSRYPSGRIHVDRAGYRTWGASHGKRSSFCLKG